MSTSIILIIFIFVIAMLVAWGIISTSIGNKNRALREEQRRIAMEKYKSQLISKHGEDIGLKLFNSEYFIGMTIPQLIDSKGQPTSIEKEELKTKTKYTYVYGNKSSGDIFVFEQGILVKFKDR